MSDLKTRRKEILSKPTSGQKLIHYQGWRGRMSEHNYIISGDDKTSDVNKTDYKWLMKKNYIKQINYEWGGISTYSLSDAGRMYWKELK